MPRVGSFGEKRVMRNNLGRHILAAVASLTLAGSLASQSAVPRESGVDTRFQLDVHVPDDALRAMLPPGFSSNAANQGPAKDANLRVIFVDREVARDSSGKLAGSGTEQFVSLVAPVKDSRGAAAQFVLGGISSNAASATAQANGLLSATNLSFAKSLRSTEGGLVEIQDWRFTAATGERFEMHIEFQRGPGFHIGPYTMPFYSAANPTVAQTTTEEEDLDILRNVTTVPPDRVRAFSFHGGGGKFTKLFSGNEQLLSWDNILWLRRSLQGT